MAYSNECPYCGANLDPGEHCNCIEEKAEAEEQASVMKITYHTQEKQNVC